MILACGACGEKIEVGPEVVDGQHVKCPFCGEKTIFSKPTRIEVPLGSAQLRCHGQQEPKKHAKLKLQRPGEAGGGDGDLNAQSIMRRIETERAEKAAAEQKEAEARRRARLEIMVRSVVIAIVIAALLGCGGWWIAKRHLEKKARMERIVRQQRAEEAAKEKAAAAETEAVRTQEAQRRAEREKRREQGRKQREAEAVARRERQEAERIAAEERSQAEKAVRERFNAALAAFDGTIALPWRSLAKKDRPGAADATFVCLMPSSNGTEDVYEIVSRSDGGCQVVLLSSAGNVQEVDFAEFEQKITATGGVLRNRDSDNAYVFCPKESAKAASVPQASERPSELRMGSLYSILRRHRMSTDRLVFDVRLNVPGRKDSAAVKAVGFDDVIRVDDINDTLRRLASAMVGAPAAGKSRRRTVVMYDGPIIKKQLNGVTLVPRNPRTYDRAWSDLAAEARRQESEELQRVEDVQRRRQDAIENKVQQLKDSASLTIRIKDSGARD